MKNRVLSEKQERLLMGYHDDACSWFGGIRARRLLSNSEVARQYVQSLSDISSIMSSPVKTRSGSVQLWQGVMRRIDQEERAAMYLGKRTFADRSRSKTAVRNFSGFQIGAPIAAAGALALVFLMLPAEQSSLQNSSEQNSSGVRMQTAQQSADREVPQQGFVVSVAANNPAAQSTASSNLATASSNLARAQNTPVPQYVRGQDPWEVEWIRSDGRVRMIPHRAGRAPILWINRQEALGRLQNPEVHRLQDGSELRILERAVPQAITVSNE